MNTENIYRTISYKNLHAYPQLNIEANELYLLHASFEEALDTDVWSHYLELLPENLKAEVLKYKRWQDRYNSLFGKLLVYVGYYIFCGKELSFFDFMRDAYGKPYIKEGNLNFNISHSYWKVICGFSLNAVGVDIEEIKDIDLKEFGDVFSARETAEIKKHGILKFYEFWTKKEAASKALGKGFSVSFQEIIIGEDHAVYKDLYWYTSTYRLRESYCAIASDAPLNEVRHIYIRF